MFCKNCGHQIDDLSKFCPQCGFQLTEGSDSPDSPESENNSRQFPADNEVQTGRIMGKFICLVLGVVGMIGSIAILINSHEDWESHVWAINGMRNSKWSYSGEYFWSFGNETWFSYAPMGFILLAGSIIVFIIGCRINGNLKKK